MSDDPDLGPCCICGCDEGVKNIVMLSHRCLVPGHGWGCMQCDLPTDGALAVLCDGCVTRWENDPALLRFACRGYPAQDGRVPIDELPGDIFDHDMTKHPEIAP
jgi:hypothetical protein